MTGEDADPYATVGPVVSLARRKPGRRSVVQWVIGGVAIVGLCLVVVGAAFTLLLGSYGDVPEAAGDPILSVTPGDSTPVNTTGGYDMDEPMRFAGVVLRPGVTTQDDVVIGVAEAATGAGWKQVPPDAASTRDGWLCFTHAGDDGSLRVLDVGPYDGSDKVARPTDVAVVVSTWSLDQVGSGDTDAPCGYASAFNGEWYPAPPPIGS
jgi:hypothetical protein